MDRPLRAVQISDRVHWVGAVDWGLSDFHGYATARGSTYGYDTMWQSTDAVARVPVTA